VLLRYDTEMVGANSSRWNVTGKKHYPDSETWSKKFGTDFDLSLFNYKYFALLCKSLKKIIALLWSLCKQILRQTHSKNNIPYQYSFSSCSSADM